MNWTVMSFRKIPWVELEQIQQFHREKVEREHDQVFLIISEPEPTITFGRSAKPGDLLWSEKQLKEKNIGLAPVSRGGKWTCHGPGQILFYPIAYLPTLGYQLREIRPFLNDFKSSAIRFIEELGLPASCPLEKPFGIYVNNEKLVSFGMAINKGISSHGLALYLSDQKPLFKAIHPCGVIGERITSLHEQNHPLEWEEASERLQNHIKKGFKCSKSC